MALCLFLASTIKITFKQVKITSQSALGTNQCSPKKSSVQAQFMSICNAKSTVTFLEDTLLWFDKIQAMTARSAYNKVQTNEKINPGGVKDDLLRCSYQG